MIAEGVTLNEGVELGRGCIIGPGVVLDAGKIVLPNTRVMVTSDTAVEFLTEELCGLAVDDQGSEVKLPLKVTLKTKTVFCSKQNLKKL